MIRKALVSAVAAALLTGTAVTAALADPVNLSGASYGGKVRSGPGIGYPQIASTYEGDRLFILAPYGSFNGYDWFQIQLPNGKTGYQWGGIMCAYGYTPGVLADCNTQGPGDQGRTFPRHEPEAPRPVTASYDNIVEYTCAEGVPMTARFTEERGGGVVYITHYVYNQLRLPQIVSGSGTQYQSGPYWFGGKGDTMTFIEEYGQTECYRVN